MWSNIIHERLQNIKNREDNFSIIFQSNLPDERVIWLINIRRVCDISYKRQTKWLNKQINYLMIILSSSIWPSNLSRQYLLLFRIFVKFILQEIGKNIYSQMYFDFYYCLGWSRVIKIICFICVHGILEFQKILRLQIKDIFCNSNI